jgi:hypothetical protein
MQLRPRHYILIAVILGIFAFNIWRNRRPKLPTDGPAPVVTTTTAPPAQTPAWSAFDHAATLRDTPNGQFDPAMQALQQQLAIASGPTVSDIKGCLTWLEFYRQGVNHPSRDPQWKDRSERHLNGCVKFHLDTTS